MKDKERKLMYQRAAQALSAIDQLETGLKEKEQWALDTARETLHEVIEESTPSQLASFLVVIRRSAKNTLWRTSKRKS